MQQSPQQQKFLIILSCNWSRVGISKCWLPCSDMCDHDEWDLSAWYTGVFLTCIDIFPSCSHDQTVGSVREDFSALLLAVEVCFPAALAGAADWSRVGSAGIVGQTFSVSWHNSDLKHSCSTLSKARSLQSENERMSSHHKDSHFSRSGSFFPLLYGNAEMINNEHIPVAAFVLYSLSLLGCHLFVLNVKKNKYRNRQCSGARAAGKVKLAWNWIYVFFYSVYLLHGNISIKHRKGLHCLEIISSSLWNVIIFVNMLALGDFCNWHWELGCPMFPSLPDALPLHLLPCYFFLGCWFYYFLAFILYCEWVSPLGKYQLWRYRTQERATAKFQWGFANLLILVLLCKKQLFFFFLIK